MLINSKSVLAFFYPNIATQPIFYKYRERRVERQTKTKFSSLTIPNHSLYYPNIAKGKGRKPNLFEFYAKPHPILSKFKRKRAETRNGFVFSALSAYKKLVLCSKANLFIFQIFYRRRMSGTPALISDRAHRHHQKENKRQGEHPPAHFCLIGEILQPTAYYPIRYRH